MHSHHKPVIFRSAALALVALLAIAPIKAVHAIDVCAAGIPNSNVVQSTPTSAFVDNADGTVTHTLTGLMWKKCAQGTSGTSCATGAAATFTWKAALGAAVTDSTAGHADWRLPNKKELESIIEYCGWGPSINTGLFPATPFSYFWSSTSFFQPQYAWRGGFNTGSSDVDFKTDNLYVRLVRGGQTIDSFDAQLEKPNLDVDASLSATKYDPLTDGLLILRYMFGERGATLTAGALGATATRTDPAAIKTYLDSIATLLDIDNNGVTDALTDGLLLVRYLLGLRDTALIQGALGPNAQRTSPGDIATYIQTLLP